MYSEDTTSHRYTTATFDKLTAEKKRRIFEIATREFSAHGFEAASINTIAKKAGISIGAMYSYFDSKSNLFLAIIEDGRKLLKDIIASLDMSTDSIYDILGNLFDITIDYSTKYADYVILYHTLSTEGMADKAKEINEYLEVDFKAFYLELLTRGIENGEVRADIDKQMMAFYLDQINVTIELVTANPYHKWRLAHYLETTDLQQRQIKQRMIELIKRSLQ